MGGAARFRQELYWYLERSGRLDVKVIGARRRVDPAWLLRREVARQTLARRVALNNVSFVAPGGERWTLLGNALHFLTDIEASGLDSSLRATVMCQATVVRLAARRSDVLIAPCAAMAERVAEILPSVSSRLVVRMHPVSARMFPSPEPDPAILCPVLFASYKHMVALIREWLCAVEGHIDPSVRLLVTASPDEVPASLARNERIELVGQLGHSELRRLWARSRAIYFPTGLESFGFPLAEARVNGRPVIARDTEQNREIAGGALYGFIIGNVDSLRHATERALAAEVTPDPEPFDPDAYFDWMLGPCP
jgi:hypothetical protein